MRRGDDKRWSYLLVRTRDGVPESWVEPVGFGTWARRLDGKSGGTHEFHLGETPAVWSRMRPARRTLVVCYDGEPVYAGVIWRATYNRNTGTATLAHEDIWSIWERRIAGPHWLSWSNPDLNMIQTQVRWENRSRSDHAKRIIQMGLRGPSGYLHSYELPIILPDDIPGSWSITYRSHFFYTVADRLGILTGYGGPMQVDFPVEWSFDGHLRWRLQVTHESPLEMHLHVESDESPVTNLTMSHDMTDYASEFHITGSGQGVESLHRYGWIGDVGGDLVALGMRHSDGTIDTGDELITVRDGLMDRHQRATVQTDVTVTMGGEAGLSPHDFTLGQQVRIHLNDDPVIPRVDGGHIFMLIGYTPDGPGQLKLELAPVDGYTGYETGEPTMHYRNLNASRVQDLYERVHRAEKRLVYDHGTNSLAAVTRNMEDT